MKKPVDPCDSWAIHNSFIKSTIKKVDIDFLEKSLPPKHYQCEPEITKFFVDFIALN